MAQARLDVAEVATAMGVDKQTIRLMIQEEFVPWGRCWKMPGSTRYFYDISPLRFYEATGIALREGLKND